MGQNVKKYEYTMKSLPLPTVAWPSSFPTGNQHYLFLLYPFLIFCVSMNNEISIHFHFPKNVVITNIVFCVYGGGGT